MAYLFFVPSIYIILTDERKNQFNAFHAAQSLMLWIILFIIFKMIRVINIFIIHFLPSTTIALIFWSTTVFFAFSTFFDKPFDIPVISKAAKWLA